MNSLEDEGWTLYFNAKGQLHKETGPACILPKIREEWWLRGTIVFAINYTKDRSEIYIYNNATEEYQEFIIRNHPDLIHRLPLLSAVKARHQHELELSKVDL